MDNPYEAPESDLTTDDPVIAGDSDIRVEGSWLVVRSGAVLPRFCVKTDEPVEEHRFRQQSLTFFPPAYALSILFGGLMLVIVFRL